MSAYKADPAMTDIPLQLSEIEALAADGGKGIGKDARKLAHFVQRVHSTVKMYKQQIQQMNRDMQELGVSHDRAGAASTLAPSDAVQYLSDTQRAELFGRVAQEQLKYMKKAQTEANHAAREARALTSRLRYKLTGLIDDTSLPASLRKELEDLLAGIGEPPPVPAIETPPPGFGMQPQQRPPGPPPGQQPAAPSGQNPAQRQAPGGRMMPPPPPGM